MDNDLLYRIAITKVPNIGDVHARSLIHQYGSAADVFKAPKRHLEKIEGIGSIRANAIKGFNDFKIYEKEIGFIEKYKITPLFITDKKYPRRLLNCYDSPVLLYYKGNADLNAKKIISVVGTRKQSDYGKYVTEKIIEELKEIKVTVVSGLAYGIDTTAHKSALKTNLPTVAVLAHGLDTIYPSNNKSLAKSMIDNGGLLTEFMSGSKPDKQNFPKRNRITAGICDALIVIESGISGGSLITAELANGYNRDVFAIPGRITDLKSEGCNMLIKKNKAAIINEATDILELMNWNENDSKGKSRQRILFAELNPNEKMIIDLFTGDASLAIEEIYMKTKLSGSSLASALLSLEMNAIITSLPGKLYKLN